MAAVPPSDQPETPMREDPRVSARRRRPAAWRLIVLECAYALLYGATQSVLSRTLFDVSERWAPPGASYPLYSVVYGWLFTLAVFPGGWLGDRHFGARRAVFVGAGLLGTAAIAALAVAVATGASPGAAEAATGLVMLSAVTVVVIAVSVMGSALIRANLPVLLGASYPIDADRRLPAFAWFDAASSLGFMALNVVGLSTDRNVTLIGALIAFTIAMTIFARADFHTAPRETSQEPGLGAPGGPTRVAVTTMIIVVVMAGAIAGTGIIDESLWLKTAIVGSCVAVPMWFVRRMRRSSTVDSYVSRRARGLAMLLTAGVLVYLFGNVATSSAFEKVIVGSRPDSWEFLRATAFLPGILIAILATRYWRRLREEALLGLRTAVAVGFVGLTGVFLSFAGMLDQPNFEYAFLPVLVLWGFIDTLVSASGLHAATALARPDLSGRTVAAWRISVSAGFRAMPLVTPAITPPDLPLLLTVGAQCLLLAFLFFPGRWRKERPEGLVEGSRTPAHRLAIRLAAICVAATTVWTVAGRYGTVGAAAPAVTVPPPQFHNVAKVFLPADPQFGFVQVPGGPTTMGVRQSSTTDTPSDVQPQVLMVGWYSIGKYEVTVAQFRQCVMELGCTASDQRALLGADTAPVRYVTWFEALRYCRWLRGKLKQIAPEFLGGNDVSLPSEPEWQRAAGDGLSPYPWNGPLTPQRANYAGSGLLAPVPVGEHAGGASAYGVQDLSGNVAEWTRSEFRRYPYDPNDGRENSLAPAASKVIRGGSFYDSASLLRIDSRQAADPNRAYDFVGFRVVLVSMAASNPATTTTPPANPAAAPTAK